MSAMVPSVRWGERSATLPGLVAATEWEQKRDGELAAGRRAGRGRPPGGEFPPMAMPLLRLNEVMTELGIGRTKARALVWTGELPVVRIGQVIRVRRSDLDAFIEANVSGPRRPVTAP